MDSRLTVAKRELAGLRAEKTILLAIGIQLFIAAFSSFLVVGLVSMYDPGALDGAEVEVAGAGDAVADLERAADEVTGASVTRYESASDARAAFDRNAADAVVVATRDDRGGITASVTAPDATVETTVIVVQLRDLLRTYERTERESRSSWLSEQPLPLPDRTGTSPYFTFTYTILIPVLVFLPVFISGSLVVDSITEEIDEGTLELLRVAPVTIGEILDGKALAAVAIAPGQALLWLLLLEANGTSVANVGTILALMTALTTLVVAVAAGIAAVAPDRRAAQFLYSIAVLVLFGGATAMAGGPTNAVARLAIDSADLATTITVAVYALLAAVAYLGVRRFVTENGISG
ncbi:ABC-type Na+ efflux pump permease subunit [Halorubrum alkaliphilum]|uniref:ABC-type Na+ efflux pump permease subunit n=1 Tax=Halorubrum alkaliphilum TaxID=261290 RepID=A0A8T4GDC1_9EURY|nr:ABC transporter permease [Halorubrum alkaliphilum]MBP1921252.1 ABC-type Na+ efflux pump permease subunit [Halorubrum alkaliphilum]